MLHINTTSKKSRTYKTQLHILSWGFLLMMLVNVALPLHSLDTTLLLGLMWTLCKVGLAIVEAIEGGDDGL